MPQALSIGELLIDFVSTATDVGLADCPGFAKAPGGAPANVACGLAKLGLSSGFIGKIGDDPFGDFLRSALEQSSVDTTHLVSGEGCRTTLAFVAIRSDGAKDIVFYRNPGADMLLSPDEIDSAYIASASLFHYGSVSLSHQPSRDATLKAIELAKQNDLLMSYDPNLRLMLWDSPTDAKKWVWEVMPYANVVKIADEEWAFIMGADSLEAGCERLFSLGVDMVVVTRGKHGCYYNNGAYRGTVPGFLVKVVDPLGAGDSFVAAMLARLLKLPDGVGLKSCDGDTLHELMTYANAAGALATQRVGVIPALPTTTEIEAFLMKASPAPAS